MRAIINNVIVELVQGDITDLATDAIVNAANSALVLGAGVAGAIRRRGGPSIQEECYRIGACEVGNAVITGAGQLAARHVIHAVGPMMGEGQERGKLASATRASLLLAERHGLESIAFPAISTGVYGYPMEGCAQIMLKVIVDFTFEDLKSLRTIIMCLYDAGAFAVFAREFSKQLVDVGVKAEE